MTGREDKKENDLFYTCALIDYIARKTKNTRSYTVTALGYENIKKIYELADVYHSDNIDSVCDSFIEAARITDGNFDNVGIAKYSIPSHWDIGKVYKRLILSASKAENSDIIHTLIKVYTSFISEKIDDYNSSFYYENPQTIFSSYESGEIE